MPARCLPLLPLPRDPLRDAFRHGLLVCCALPAGLAWAQPGTATGGGQASPPVAVAPAAPPRSALWLSVEAQRHRPAASAPSEPSEPSATRRLSEDERALMRAQIRDYHGVRASAVSAAVAPETAPAKPSVPVAR